MPWAMVGLKQCEQAGLLTQVKNDLLNHLRIETFSRGCPARKQNSYGNHIP